jgi:HK97 family phage portal protein
VSRRDAWWRDPLDMPAPPRNDHPQTPLSGITPGTSIFADLSGYGQGLTLPTEQSALTVSAIYACVNLIAGAIATLPINVFKRSPDGELEKLPSDDLWWVLNEQMTPRWSAACGWEFLLQSLLLQGDGFARIVRNPLGVPIGLEPIHPARVTVVCDGARLIYVVEPDPTVIVSLRGDRVALDQDDVLHIPGFGFDGLRGSSPLRYALRMTGAVALAAQDYSARFFSNGARPDYALRTTASMNPEQIETMRAQVSERHGGAANAHRPMLLTNGLEIQTITLPAEDMQLLATRQFQIEETARVYGVPPFMIGHNEKTTSWGSGVAAMGTGFVRYSLRRHLNKIQNELNRKLFRTAARVVAFDTTDLERADLTTLIAAFRAGIGRAGEPGFVTTEEAREAMGLSRVPQHGRLNPGLPAAPGQTAAPGDADAPSPTA